MPTTVKIVNDPYFVFGGLVLLALMLISLTSEER